MCYNAYTNQCSKKRVAKKDMKVFKVGRLHSNHFISYYQNYTYEAEVEQPKIRLLYNAVSKTIICGYYSYKYAEFKIWEHTFLRPYIINICIDTYKNITKYSCSFTEPIIIGKFIIPKGSVYYQNIYNEIVSEQIKFTGIIYIPNCTNFNTIYRDKIILSK